MDRKKIPKDFEENRTRVFSPRNRYPSDSATLPSAAKLQSRLPYTIGSDPRLQRFVRWSGGTDSRMMGMWDSKVNGESPMVGFLAVYHGN